MEQSSAAQRVLQRYHYDQILHRYQQQLQTPGDIHEHLPTLRRYAAACRNGRVAEFGVRFVVSTWALLLGLVDGGKPRSSLIGVDIETKPGFSASALSRGTV